MTGWRVNHVFVSTRNLTLQQLYGTTNTGGLLEVYRSDRNLTLHLEHFQIINSISTQFDDTVLPTLH